MILTKDEIYSSQLVGQIMMMITEIDLWKINSKENYVNSIQKNMYSHQSYEKKYIL